MSGKQPPERDRKGLTIQLRVTPEQKRLMQEGADREGLNLSSWIRFVSLKAAKAAK